MKKLSKLLVLILALALTVCAFAGLTASASEPDPVATKAATATIAAKNLSYTGAVQVMYYVSTNAEVDPETQELKVLVSDTTFESKTLVGVAPSSVEGVSVKQQRGNISIPDRAVQYALFYSDAIAPVELRKNIYAVAVLVDKDSGNITYASSELEYSPYLYAMDRFSAQPSENQLALYKALLDYGAAVQTVLIKGDEDTTFEDKLAAVGGWADAYYLVTEKTSVNGVVDETKTKAPDYYRPSSVFSATRFASGNTTDTTHSFVNWTSGDEEVDANWLYCTAESLAPGAVELVKNYKTSSNDIITHNDGTGVSSAAGTNKTDVDDFGDFTGIYHRYVDGAFELGKYNKQATGASFKWDTPFDVNILTGYAIEFDMNLQTLNPITSGTINSQWFAKIMLVNANSNESFNLIFEPVVVNGTYSTTEYNLSGIRMNIGEWYSIRIEVNRISLGNGESKLETCIYVNEKSRELGRPVSYVSNDGKQVGEASFSSFAMNIRSASQTSKDVSFLVDNVYSEITSTNDFIDGGKNYADSVKFASDADVNANVVNNGATLTVTDGALKSTANGAASFGFKNLGSATANAVGAKHVFETDFKLESTAAAKDSTIMYITFGNADGSDNGFVLPVKAIDADTFKIGGAVFNYGVWYNIRIVYVNSSYLNGSTLYTKYDVYLNGLYHSTTDISADIAIAAPAANFVHTAAAADLVAYLDNTYLYSTGDTVDRASVGLTNDYSDAATVNGVSFNKNGNSTVAGQADVSNGALNIHFTGTGYSQMYFNTKYPVIGATVDTVYVFEMDFTFLGGNKGEGDGGIAFIGFTSSPDNPSNGNMYKWSQLKFSDAVDGEGDAPYVTLFGQTYYKNKPVKIRYEYNVSSDTMYIYHDGVYAGTASFGGGDHGNVETTIYGFGAYVRGKHANGFEATIDNTYCGVVTSAADQTVTVDAANGSATSTLTLNYGSAISGLATPTKNVTIDGQQYPAGFLGWYVGDIKVDNGDAWFGFGTETITAKWADPHKVTLTPVYGAVTPSSTAFYKGQSYTLSAPTGAANGYDFLGWYNGETLVASEGVWTYDADVTLTALWSFPYNVTLNVGNGTASVATFEMKLGRVYDLSTVTLTAPSGYEFVGWYTTSNYTHYLPMTGTWAYEYDELTTIYARFEKIDSGRTGNSKYAADSYDFDTLTTAGEKPFTLPNNVVVGGYADGNRWWNILSDLGNKYVVLGQKSKNDPTMTFPTYKKVAVESLSADAPEGKTSAKVIEFDFMVIGAESTKSANWFAKFVFSSKVFGSTDALNTITPDNTGNYTLSGASDTKIAYNQWANIRYEFFDNGDSVTTYNLYVNGNLVAENKTLNVTLYYSELDLFKINLRAMNNDYAEVAIDNVYIAEHAIAAPYEITLNAGGGTVNGTATATYEVKFGESYDLSTYTLVKEGSTPIGWYYGDTPIALTGTWEYEEPAEGTITLTYKWYDPHTITLNAGDGTLTGNNTVTMKKGDKYGDGQTIAKLPTPTAPEGLVFSGWYIGLRRVDADGTWKLDKDVTLTAKYASAVDVYADQDDKDNNTFTRTNQAHTDYDDTTHEYGEGTKFIVYMTFTYKGGSPVTGSNPPAKEGEGKPAFVQFVSNSYTDSRNSWDYLTYDTTETVTIGDTVYWKYVKLGALKFEINVTYNLRFEFTVGKDYKSYSMTTYVLDDEGNVLQQTKALTNAPQQTYVDLEWSDSLTDAQKKQRAKTTQWLRFQIQVRGSHDGPTGMAYSTEDVALIVEEPTT